MGNKLKKYNFRIIFTAVLFCLCACSDKNLDDYSRDRLNINFSKANALAGSYRGTITIKQDAAVVKMAEIDLKADSNQISANNQPFLSGSMTLINSTQSVVAIQNMRFIPDDNNSNNGTLSGTISIPVRDGSTAQMSITGSILDNTFSGEVNTTDRSGYPGKFTVVKDADFPKTSQDITTPNNKNNVQVYLGSYIDPLCNKKDSNNPSTANMQFCQNKNALTPVKMTVNAIAPTSAETFLNNFVTQKNVRIELTLNNDTGFTITFTNAHLEGNFIHGDTSTTSVGGSSNAVNLDCTLQDSNTYSCNYYGGGFSHAFEVKLDPQGSS